MTSRKAFWRPRGRGRVQGEATRSCRTDWRNYIYADHAAPLLPAGTTIVITAWHDNTENNPNNPDPTQWVGWGDRTVDEMAHAWVDVTYLSQEEYDREVAKREAMKTTEDEGPGGPNQ